jgi:protoporphyrinogen/coproporphyrinogen III oxidase
VTRLLVVGGGISGLAAAWEAASAGFDVTVLEASPAVGGKLRVEEVAGIPVDVGAEALLAARPEGIELISQTGLSDEQIVPLTTAAGIRAGGRTFPLPARTVMGVPGDLDALRSSGVLTGQGVAAVQAEADLSPLPPVRDDISVGQLVRARMGAEVVDRLVEPLLGGVYAGRADALSLQATLRPLAAALERDGGSLLAAARTVAGAGTRSSSTGPVFVSLRGGLGRLPQVVAGSGRFAIRTSTTVRTISRAPSGFAVDCGPVPRSERLEADVVIVATPPGKAARLLRTLAPRAAAELAGIETASVAIVSFAYRTPPGTAGSGLLVAASERLAVKGVTLTSAKWPIAADGLFLLRASVGRAGENLALQLEDAQLIELVGRELRALLGIAEQPVDARVTRWGGGLPQYGVGHVQRVARIRAAVAEVGGLAVCGAALDGIGVPACIASARAAVHAVSDVSGR